MRGISEAKKLIFALLVFAMATLGAAPSVLAQRRLVWKYRTVWVKNALPTESTCKITITKLGVISLGRKDCVFSKFLETGSRVRLAYARGSRDSTFLKIKPEQGKAIRLTLMYAEGRKVSGFLNKFFSSRDDDDYRGACDIHTRREALGMIGFPNSLTRAGNSETWLMRADSHPFWNICGFDDTQLKFRNGRLVQISGSI